MPPTLAEHTQKIAKELKAANMELEALRLQQAILIPIAAMHEHLRATFRNCILDVEKRVGASLSLLYSWLGNDGVISEATEILQSLHTDMVGGRLAATKSNAEDGLGAKTDAI